MTSASSLKEKFYKHHLRKENFPGSHIIHFLLAVVILYFNWQLQTISLMIDIFSTDLLSKLAKKTMIHRPFDVDPVWLAFGR